MLNILGHKIRSVIYLNTIYYVSQPKNWQIDRENRLL